MYKTDSTVYKNLICDQWGTGNQQQQERLFNKLENTH